VVQIHPPQPTLSFTKRDLFHRALPKLNEN
jgi:hypothetical protein